MSVVDPPFPPVITTVYWSPSPCTFGVKLTESDMVHLDPTFAGATQDLTSFAELGSVTAPQLFQPSGTKLATQGGFALLTVKVICSPGSASKVPSSFDLISDSSNANAGVSRRSIVGRFCDSDYPEVLPLPIELQV